MSKVFRCEIKSGNPIGIEKRLCQIIEDLREGIDGGGWEDGRPVRFAPNFTWEIEEENE